MVHIYIFQPLLLAALVLDVFQYDVNDRIYLVLPWYPLLVCEPFDDTSTAVPRDVDSIKDKSAVVYKYNRIEYSQKWLLYKLNSWQEDCLARSTDPT